LYRGARKFGDWEVNPAEKRRFFTGKFRDWEVNPAGKRRFLTGKFRVGEVGVYKISGVWSLFLLENSDGRWKIWV
jgi:hypothetical protein